jgi:hypothetical protein
LTETFKRSQPADRLIYQAFGQRRYHGTSRKVAAGEGQTTETGGMIAVRLESVKRALYGLSDSTEPPSSLPVVEDGARGFSNPPSAPVIHLY